MSFRNPKYRKYKVTSFKFHLHRSSRRMVFSVIVMFLLTFFVAIAYVTSAESATFPANMKTAIERFENDLRQAERQGTSEAFLSVLDRYLAEDASISVQTQGQGIGMPNAPHQQQMTKAQYMKEARLAHERLEDYSNTTRLIGLNVFNNGQIATFTLNSDAEGKIAVDNGIQGLEGLNRNMKIRFQSFHSCVNTAVIEGGALKIKNANCTGSTHILPVNAVDDGLQKKLEKYGYN